MRILALALMALVACGDDDGSTDGGADGAAVCTIDSDCRDDVFCNGDETCDPSDPSSDVRGCVTASACMPTQTCNEATDECITDCETPDADGDGAMALSCGGADCDDSDPNRYPGNTEVCDPDDRDEDCDPATFGFRDGDGDGFPDARCCNDDGSGAVCGTDCDDTLPAVHPTEAEVCDSLDNDCDGDVDEDALVEYWPDGDGDGRGTDDPDAVSMLACTTPDGHAELRGDCNDDNPAIAMGLPELCDGLGLDEDCDMAIDEGERVDCYPDADDDTYAVMGATTMMVCRDATRAAVGGCPVNFTNRAPTAGARDCNDLVLSIHPGATETCNGVDDDCDGTDDDGFFCASGSVASCTTSAGCGSLSGSRTCTPDCSAYSPCSLPGEGPGVAGTCNACDDDLDGDTDEGFACERDSTVACTVPVCGTAGLRTCGASCTLGACLAAETCDYCDEDGDGGIRADEIGFTTSLNHDFDPVGAGGVTLVTGFAEFLAAIISSGDNALGQAEFTPNITIGYGTITMESEVVAAAFSGAGATPAHGWSLYMYRVGSGTGSASAATYGRPTNRYGFAGEWRWQGATADQGALVAIRVGTSDPVIGTRNAISPGLSSGSVTQHARLIVTPDNPDTAQDETRIDFGVGGGSGYTRVELCDSRPGGDPDCVNTVSPGEVWRFGISHGGGSGTASRTSLTNNRANTTLQVNSVCP